MRLFPDRLLLLLLVTGCGHRQQPPPTSPPPAAAPAPTAASGQKYMPPNVARGHLAINPLLPQYSAEFPPELNVSGNSAWAMLRVCAGSDGQVNDVTILKSAHPLLDERIVMAIRTWHYRPYLVDGRPVPFCTNVRYEMKVR